MHTVIEIIGIVFVLIAIGYLIKPAVLKNATEFLEKRKRIPVMYLFSALIGLVLGIVILLAYLCSALNGLSLISGLIRLALAVVFLLGVRECVEPWVIFAFGIIFLLSGLLVFMLRLEWLKSYSDWWQKHSLLLIRILAVITFAFGVIIIISA